MRQNPICDREADIYDLFEVAYLNQFPFVVSAHQDRTVNKKSLYSKKTGEKLWKLVSGVPCQGEIQVNIPARDNKPKRTAILEVRFNSFIMNPTKNNVKRKTRKLTDLKLNAVYIMEKSPPIGEEPMNWMLLTNISINNFEAAVEKIQWYCLRWRIEIFHKILKSGFKVEECRLQTADRLIRFLTIMSVIAWRVFFITLVFRVNPNLPCTTLLADEEWKGFCRIKVYLLYCDFIILSYCHMSIIRKAFRRLHYPIDVIALCVRWYLSYSLSLRNIEEMMAERGITLDHSTLHRWVVRLIPLMNKTFRKYKRQTSKHWRMDETYIKVKGKWQYLYRAVDKYGKTIDFLLTARRDTAAALRFFKKAISQHGVPEVVTIDKSGANTAALKVINKDKPEKEAIGILQNKYLNNMIEQDHRNIKRRIRPMLGFKSFRFAKIILGGIELIHMIRKGQFQHPHGIGLSNAQQFYLLAA